MRNQAIVWFWWSLKENFCLIAQDTRRMVVTLHSFVLMTLDKITGFMPLHFGQGLACESWNAWAHPAPMQVSKTAPGDLIHNQVSAESWRCRPQKAQIPEEGQVKQDRGPGDVGSSGSVHYNSQINILQSVKQFPFFFYKTNLNRVEKKRYHKNDSSRWGSINFSHKDSKYFRLYGP